MEWELAHKRHGLGHEVSKRHVAAGNASRDFDGNGTHDEVDDVGQILWRFYPEICGTFEYYCCLISDAKDAEGEVDLFSLCWDAFAAFLHDVNSYSEKFKQRDAMQIWETVNAADDRTASIDRFNRDRFFCRHEFMQAICRIGILKYNDSRAVHGVSEAIDRFCRETSRAVPPEALQHSNSFRKGVCYHEGIDTVLRKYERPLRAAFKL